MQRTITTGTVTTTHMLVTITMQKEDETTSNQNIEEIPQTTVNPKQEVKSIKSIISALIEKNNFEIKLMDCRSILHSKEKLSISKHANLINECEEFGKPFKAINDFVDKYNLQTIAQDHISEDERVGFNVERREIIAQCKNLSILLNDIGMTYSRNHQYYKACVYFQYALEIYSLALKIPMNKLERADTFISIASVSLNYITSSLKNTRKKLPSLFEDNAMRMQLTDNDIAREEEPYQRIYTNIEYVAYILGNGSILEVIIRENNAEDYC